MFRPKRLMISVQYFNATFVILSNISHHRTTSYMTKNSLVNKPSSVDQIPTLGDGAGQIRTICDKSYRLSWESSCLHYYRIPCTKQHLMKSDAVSCIKRGAMLRWSMFSTDRIRRQPDETLNPRVQEHPGPDRIRTGATCLCPYSNECRKRDLNPHGIATTRTWTVRVCQFRHFCNML